MARIRRDVNFRFRLRAMQIPGARHWANNVVSPLHNHAGYVPNLPDVFNQIVIARKETVVHEVMAFDAGEGLRKCRISKSFDRLRIEEEFRSGAFPDTPRARRFDSHLLIIAYQSAIISAHHIATIIFGNDFHEFFPHVSKDPTSPFLIEPFDLYRTTKKDPS